MEVRDTRLRSSLLKNIYLSHDFEAFLEVRALEKNAYLNACLFSTDNQSLQLDSQSKFQIFKLFSGRYIGVTQMYTNMGF